MLATFLPSCYLQANTTNNTGGDQRRLFTAKTCVGQSNVDAPKNIVKNIDIAARQAPGLKHFLDFSDMEPSKKGLANCDFLTDDYSAPSLETSHCSEHFQNDYTDDEEQSLGSEEDWEPLDSPPTFMDNVVPIDVANKPVDLQELDFFLDALEAPLESVQNELEVFDDAAEDIFHKQCYSCTRRDSTNGTVPAQCFYLHTGTCCVWNRTLFL